MRTGEVEHVAAESTRDAGREAGAPRGDPQRAGRRQQGRHQRARVRRGEVRVRPARPAPRRCSRSRARSTRRARSTSACATTRWFVAYAPADQPTHRAGGAGRERRLRRAGRRADRAPGARLLPARRSGQGAGAGRRTADADRRTIRATNDANSSRASGSSWPGRSTALLFGIALAHRGGRLVTLFSAADQSTARVTNQVVNLAIALGAMWVVANIPPQTLARIGGAAVRARRGPAGRRRAVRRSWSTASRRWLNLGVTRIQPSELMKIALPLMLAWYFQKFEGRIGWKDFVFAAVLHRGARRPDQAPAGPRHRAAADRARGFYVLFLAGLSWKVIVGLRAVAGAAAPLCGTCCTTTSAAGSSRSSTRRRTRWARATTARRRRSPSAPAAWSARAGSTARRRTSTSCPSATPTSSSRSTARSSACIGNVVLVVLYLLLIGRGMMIAANASTLFGRLMAGAVTLMFFTYAFVNMGMVSGVLPVVGVPLPFVSLRRHGAAVAVHRDRHPDERAGAPQARALVAARRVTLGAAACGACALEWAPGTKPQESRSAGSVKSHLAVVEVRSTTRSPRRHLAAVPCRLVWLSMSMERCLQSLAPWPLNWTTVSVRPCRETQSQAKRSGNASAPARWRRSACWS